MENRTRYGAPLAIATTVFFLLAALVWLLFRRGIALLEAGDAEHFFIFGTSTEAGALVYLFMLGLVVALLLAAIVFLLAATRQRAGKIADTLTEDLVSSRELFLTLYEHSPVPYILISEHGAITFPNTAAVRLFGKVKGELEGESLFTLIQAESEEERQHVELLPVRFRQGVTINGEEVQIVRADGTTRFVMLSAYPLRRAASVHTGLVTLVDITKQKEIDRAKTEFVSLASHQLRTPISSLKWNVELLQSPKAGSLTARQLEHVGMLRRGILRMDNIIEDFLDVSRLELGTLVPEMKLVDIPQLADRIIEEMHETIQKKQLAVQTHFEVRSCTTDSRLLRMVLENLISNAVKYTPPGGEVRVHTEAAGESVEILVSDTGFGIPEEEQEKLFTKLFRASNVREEVPDGTGLGLYIVTLVLEVLGGRIVFASKLGSGSTFTVTLPRLS